MKWSDVKAGDALLVKGERWEVTSRDGDAVTMRHATLGEKTGSPPPDGEVTKAQPVGPRPDPVPEARPERRPLSERSERIVEAERKATERRERVARDNGVAVEAVEALGVRITLGGSLIGVLRPKADPQVSEVGVMDVQTMRNHLHFFHDCYPEDGFSLEELVALHDEHEATEAHDHTVPF